MHVSNDITRSRSPSGHHRVWSIAAFIRWLPRFPGGLAKRYPVHHYLRRISGGLGVSFLPQSSMHSRRINQGFPYLGVARGGGGGGGGDLRVTSASQRPSVSWKIAIIGHDSVATFDAWLATVLPAPSASWRNRLRGPIYRYRSRNPPGKISV